MSLHGEHDASFAGEFVESLMLERDLPSTNAIAAIGVSATFLDQPPMFVEASSQFGHPDEGGLTYHQHRTLAGIPLLNALIYGGSSGIGNNVQLVNLPAQIGTGFYRAYFRIKGICPLIPWDPASPIDIVESRWHLNPYMWEAWIESRTTLNYIQGNIISTVRFFHHPDNDVGPPQIYESSQILNRTAQPTTTVPLGAYSIDRIVGFSIKASVGGQFYARHAGRFCYAGPGQAWYQSAPTADITWPSTATQAEILALQGTPMFNPGTGSTDFAWRNDAGLNPPSLLPPYSPMIPASIGQPQTTNYLQVQYIGHRPEATARQEEIIDLIPPLLVTTLP